MYRGCAGVALDLRAQAADVDGDGRGVGVKREAPHLLHELVAREGLAGVAGEEEEQVELALREHDLLAIDEHAAPGGVDLELAEDQRRLGPVVGVGSVRRSTASTRATSSAGENGLTT